MKQLGIIANLTLVGFYSLVLARSSIANAMPVLRSVSSNAIELEATNAERSTNVVNVSPGRATAIIFETGEVISFVLLSDDSQTLYFPNAPIESGRATVLYLRQRQKNITPGSTQSQRPNLFINTVDRQGNFNSYEFEIHFSPIAANKTKIRLVSQRDLLLENAIETTRGTATIFDIERGLQVAIAQGELSTDEEIVRAIDRCLDLAYTRVPLTEAATRTNVPLSLLKQLGEIGLQERLSS